MTLQVAMLQYKFSFSHDKMKKKGYEIVFEFIICYIRHVLIFKFRTF